MSAIRWATFDCFGTLVDWRHGIANGIDLLFPGQGRGLPAECGLRPQIIGRPCS